jgi:hypothetical protein
MAGERFNFEATAGRAATFVKRRIVIVISTAAFIAVAGVAMYPAFKRHGEMVSCSNQMSAILFEATLDWPQDHDGHLPYDFLSMSNELGTPRILVCPADHAHQPAASWASFSSNNCSYEIVSPGVLSTNTNAIFMRCNIHGFVGYADDRLVDASGKLVKPNRFW